MLKKAFYFSALMIGIFAVFSLWAANFSLISFPVLIIGLLASVVLSFFILKEEHFESDSIKKSIPIIALALFVLIFLLFSLGSNFINPFTCSDLMNHSNATRLLGEIGGIDSEKFTVKAEGLSLIPFSHNYPMHLRATTALFYTAIPNAYLLNSVYPILLLSISILGFYFVSRKFLSNRYSVFSAVIYAFTISNFFLLDAGYLNQLFGQFFFISSLLAFLDNKKILLPIFLANLIVFPHYFVIFLFFLIIQSFVKKDFKILIPALIAPLIILPEVIGLIGNAIVYSDPLRYFALLRGGITVTNFFGLLILIPALFGVQQFFLKEKNKLNELNLVLLSIILMILALFGLFIINMIFSLSEVKIYQLYMPAKISYLLLAFAAIYSAKGFEWLEQNVGKKIFPLLILLLVFNAFYFVGFSIENSNKTSFDSGYYSAIEFLHSKDEKFTLGVDSCMLELEPFKEINVLYKSPFDVASEQGKNVCRVIQTGWDFEFKESKRVAFDEEIGDEIVDEQGNLIVKKGSQNADYFITDCSLLNKPVIFEEGNTRIYDLR